MLIENLPIGMCDITYGDQTLSNFADKAIFNAIPTYQPIHGGVGNTVITYLLEDYRVSLQVALSFETYESLKLAIPTLKEYENGFIDNPSSVKMEGKPLIIHPREAKDRSYDIVIFKAILDPEKPYERRYDKKADKIHVRFMGLPVMINGEQSYYYLGDWEAGGILAIT